ncbi:apolipoprotein N-acyltransferase [uncultured Tessaracoccus sp.]|uniref:apolipoprotein N-acyltransferase n=1 Tax=uncultured Tessaracoccus sp. TaxID=905023 RepID=UPI0025E4BFA4|nr:apolipoprotein N-acyltransferase [uncultured Tessaracoccus sp.]
MIERTRLPRPAELLLAVLAGLAIGAGQPPLGLWPLTMLGLALTTWLVAGMSRRAAFGHGYLLGLAMNVLTISWISVLGVPVAAALIAYSSLWSALAALVIRCVLRLPGWPVWVAMTWVATEFVSGRWPFGGFAWTRLAFTTVDQPLAGYLPGVGAAGVGLLVAWLSQLLLSRARLRAAAVLVVAFAVGGALLLVPPGEPEQRVTVAAVQPNVNRHEYGGPRYATAVTNNALSATVIAMAEARTQGREVDVVLWPESASDHDPLRDDEARRSVDLSAKLAGAPVLVGAVTIPDDPPDSRQTTGLVWDPATGPGDRYHKRNLVPFGEWIPFRDVLLPRFPILRLTGRQSVPGEGPGVLDVPTARHPSLRIGDVICFELAYDDTVHDVVRGGATVVVSQSNENTYAGTAQIAQQLAMNRVRAKELRREIVVSTLNSVSGWVDARGRLHEPSDEFEGAARVVDVPLRYRATPAVTVGPLISRLSTAAVVGALLALALGHVRERGKLARTKRNEVPNVR